MKIAVNTCYGGFDLKEKFLEMYFSNFALSSEEIKEQFPYDYYEIKNGDIERNDKEFIKAIEEYETKFNENVGDSYSHIKIIEIPDEATDWMITEYDGLETIYYVLDGKIKLK